MAAHRNLSGVALSGGESTGDTFTDCDNVTVIGRRYTGTEGYGLSFLRCRNVRVIGCDFEGFGRGVVLSLCSGFTVAANRFRAMKVDGVNVAQSWRGVVADNDFTDPDTGEAHPDAVQLWSRPTMRLADKSIVPAPPTSDIVIARNRVRGMLTQGVTAFNHIRDGVDDGGFDRITITANEIAVGMPQALALYSGRNCIVTDNRVSTLDGAKTRASINLRGCTDLIRRGNTVAPGAGKPAADDPP